MTKNFKKQSAKDGPKTRAQLKRLEERNRKGNKEDGNNNESEGSVARDDTRKKGWTSLQDVEAKLKALERQYNNAKDVSTKKKV